MKNICIKSASIPSQVESIDVLEKKKKKQPNQPHTTPTQTKKTTKPSEFRVVMVERKKGLVKVK